MSSNKSSHRRRRLVRPVHAIVLWLSSLAYAGALLGNAASGLFVHRAPGYLARTDTIVAFYHAHELSGRSTAICGAIAFVALCVFVWAVARVIRGNTDDGHWPNPIAQAFYYLAAFATLAGYLACRVVALALGLVNANHLGGSHPWIHTENIAVNAGNLAIRVGFGLFILTVGVTLAVWAKQKNLKLLGVLMIIPGMAAVLLPLLLGVGTACWVLGSGIWLGIHQRWLVRHHAVRVAEPDMSVT